MGYALESFHELADQQVSEALGRSIAAAAAAAAANVALLLVPALRWGPVTAHGQQQQQ